MNMDKNEEWESLPIHFLHPSSPSNSNPPVFVLLSFPTTMMDSNAPPPSHTGGTGLYYRDM